MLMFCQIPIAAHASDPRIDWRVPGAAANQVIFDHADLTQIEVVYAPAATAPVINLRCTNPATAESASFVLRALQSRTDGATFLTGEWARFPYPIDPGAVESKPMAIISQKYGISPFSMTPTVLRDAFREVAGYMLTTAQHHYAIPFGDGLLACVFIAGEDTSRPLMVRFGRGLPEGAYPRSDLRAANSPLWLATDTFQPNLVPGPAAPASGQSTALTPAQNALIRRWDNGSTVGPWIEITLDAIIRANLNPVRAARVLALVSAAMSDAGTLSTRLAKRSCAAQPAVDCMDGTNPSESTAVVSAASDVLGYLFPKRAAEFAAWAQEAAQTRLWAGADQPAQSSAGMQLGTQVAALAIARAQSDGADAKWSGPIAESAAWKPTLPDYVATPLEPLAGTWKPWNLTSGAQFRPPAPAPSDSAELLAEAREIYAATTPLSLEHQELASYWEDKKGSYTPPGHWNVIALRAARTAGLSTSESALLFATLNTALADAFIACWDAKYTYWAARPVTVIRDRIDPAWEPYIYTPPFPSYVSGHATASGAAAVILGHFFPMQQWDALAQAAALSRLYGGIHFRADNEAGLALGRQIAAVALARLPKGD